MKGTQIQRTSSIGPLQPNLYSHNPAIEAQVRRLLPIGELLSDPAVQEISINSGGRVYVDRGGRAMETTTIAVPENNLHVVIRLLKAADGGYLDPEAPFATLTLSCGGRFHGALPPAAPEAQVSIRTHRRILRALSEFMPEHLIELVRKAVLARKSIVVAGGTFAGKTTLLNSLIELIPREQRIVLIEDAPEIQIGAGRNVVRRIARGRADIRRHVFEALRDRPDWICVGETRDASARDLLDASRTGHPGLSTVHAASAEGAITRLMSLADCNREFVREALQLVLFIERMPNGRRTVTQIKEIE